MYDQIFVTFEDCLGFVKSGAREQRNIADFRPDFNLWYALKFAVPKRITIISERDISHSPLSGYIDDELRYLSVWLSQVTGVHCDYGYSYNGDWKFLFGYPSDKELLDHFRVPGRVLFIDRNSGTSKGYVSGKHGIEYTTSSEFVRAYNKNAR